MDFPKPWNGSLEVGFGCGGCGGWRFFFKNVTNVLFLFFFVETVSWMDWTPGSLGNRIGRRALVFGWWVGGVGFSKNVSNVLSLSFFCRNGFLWNLWTSRFSLGGFWKVSWWVEWLSLWECSLMFSFFFAGTTSWTCGPSDFTGIWFFFINFLIFFNFFF